MALVAPPVDLVHPVTPYPQGKARRNAAPVHLKDLIVPNRPCVLHLYTG